MNLARLAKPEITEEKLLYHFGLNYGSKVRAIA